MRLAFHHPETQGPSSSGGSELMTEPVVGGMQRAFHPTLAAESYRPERPRDMSKTGMTRVSVKPGEPLPRGDTDWARLDAMTDAEVMAAALSDPDAQPLSEEQLSRMRRVSRVTLLRRRLGMTQAQFAQAFQLPISILRDWEQHRSSPDAPARALLLAIERDPEAMRLLLAPSAA
jgi:putative transcriptional regulator